MYIVKAMKSSLVKYSNLAKN